MQTENKNKLHFVELILKSKSCNYIIVEVYSKPSNSFTYVDPSNCYPRKIENEYIKALLYDKDVSVTKMKNTKKGIS